MSGALIGSSPRAWGTPSRRRRTESTTRFIPTGVGNTSSSSGPHVANSVHPHGRGEHWVGQASTRISCGSSPRAWGTPLRAASLRRPARFIPTGVGNTGKLRPMSCTTTVHPHGRGEHASLSSAGHRCGGSSPRAWGTHGRYGESLRPLRFIPTGVGNTRRST